MTQPALALRPLSATLLACLVLAAGCAQQPPAPPPAGLLDVAARPAEHALLAGIRAYDDGQYTDAEQSLERALKLGLASPKDRAAANKHLAFIYCSTQRMQPCESAFRAAREADPAFALSRSEAGHPLWGPVYQRVQR